MPQASTIKHMEVQPGFSTAISQRHRSGSLPELFRQAVNSVETAHAEMGRTNVRRRWMSIPPTPVSARALA
jgi:hypothetical protein